MPPFPAVTAASAAGNAVDLWGDAALHVVQESKFLGVRIQIDLPRQIADAELTDVVLDQGHRHDQRQIAFSIVSDVILQFLP
jgi:hypothetical protein